MVNQDIVNYLIEGKRRGFTLALLKNKLLEGGFEETDIDDAIASLPVEKLEMSSSSKQLSSATTMKPQPFAKSSSGDTCDSFSFFKKIRCALVKPARLFEKTADENLTKTLLFQERLSLIPFVVFSVGFVALLYFFSEGLAASSLAAISSLAFSTNLLTIFFASLAVFLFILLPLSAFVYVAVTQLFVALMKGKGHYTGTYKAFIYGAVPSLVMYPFLLLLFFVGPYGDTVAQALSLIPTVWSFVLIVLALKQYQQFSGAKSFFAVLFGIILFILIVVALLIGLAMLSPQPIRFGFSP